MAHPGQQMRGNSTHAMYVPWMALGNQKHPNKWVPHDAVPLSPPFANTSFADQQPLCIQDSKWEATVPMPCTWGIGNTPNGVPPIPVAFTAPSLTLVHSRWQTRGDGAHVMYVAWAMGIGNMPSSDHEHFSHPFLGTYEVVQFLELGNLKGTHPSRGGIWASYQSHGIMGCKPHTISLSFQYQVTSYHTIGIIETYHIPGQPIPPSHSCHRVSGVLFTKYKKYFCRLQYWSIRLHFLWTGSLDFFWHFKLQVEAIGWTLSFENQLNCALSQLLAICTLDLAIYTLDNPSQAT